MIKTITIGDRKFSMEVQRTFSPYDRVGDYGFDQDALTKKYPKAMTAMIILTQAMQPTPLKALLPIAEGKRQPSEREVDQLLARAEKFLNELISQLIRKR